MIKSNKNMLRMLTALAFTMSPVFAVAACNTSTKDDQAKLKTGDLSKLKIIDPEIKAFNNVKNKTAVTTEEITTIVNTIVKTAIDQIVTNAELKVDYSIKIEKNAKTITGTYDLTSKVIFDRTFDVTVIKTQIVKLKGEHQLQKIVFPELRTEKVVVTKSDLSILTNIDSIITVDAISGTNTSDVKIKTAVEAKVLEAVKKLPNGTAVEATDLEITIKNENETKLDAITSLKNELTVKAEVKASDAGETKLVGTKTITVKIAKITPVVVVVKADLSGLGNIDSAITVEAIENTDTSAVNIETTVKEKVLEAVKKLPNGTAVEATDLEITIKNENETKLDAITSLKNELTVKAEVKASDAGETKLVGTKTITVKIAKITPVVVVVKADLSGLGNIDSAITVEAIENTDTSAVNIETTVKEKVLEAVKKLPNGTAVEATDLEITIKNENETKLDAITSLKNELTVKAEVKASDAGETKLVGTKTITVKIAKITPVVVVVKADLSGLGNIDSAITVEAIENTDTSAVNIETTVKEKVLEAVKKLPNGTAVEATDLEITIKNENETKLDAITSLKNELTVKAEVKASDAGETKLVGTKTITVKIAKITPVVVVVKADLSGLGNIDSAITVEAIENTDTSAVNIETTVKEKVLEAVKKLPNGTAVEATDLEITIKNENETKLDAITSLKNELTVKAEVKASDAGETKLVGTKTITVKIAKITPVVVVVKADLSGLGNIDSAITVEAIENTDTSAVNIETTVKEKVLEAVKKLPNGTAVEATDLEITIKNENGTKLDAITSLKNELTVKAEVKASDAGETKLVGTKTITVKIAKITPVVVVVKADLSGLGNIDSAITVEAIENTDTSAVNIETTVKEKVLEAVKKLPNGTAVEATDLEITIKNENETKLDAITSLKNELTVKAEVKASDAGETKLVGTKTITVKIAKITPVVVVVKADLSGLGNIDSAITVEAIENTDTSAVNIETTVKEKVLEAVKKLPNGTAVEATDLEITIKNENGTKLDAITSLKNELTVKAEVKASDAGETKLVGTKTITVKIAQLI